MLPKKKKISSKRENKQIAVDLNKIPLKMVLNYGLSLNNLEEYDDKDMDNVITFPINPKNN